MTRQDNPSIESPEVLEKIRKILRKTEWPEGETDATSDTLQDLLNTHTAIIHGLLFILDEDDLPHIRNTEAEALRGNWIKLSHLLEKREQEHDKIINLAFRGDETKSI